MREFLDRAIDSVTPTTVVRIALESHDNDDGNYVYMPAIGAMKRHAYLRKPGRLFDAIGSDTLSAVQTFASALEKHTRSEKVTLQPLATRLATIS